MPRRHDLTDDQLYALKGLVNEFSGDYIDVRYVQEKLNIVFRGQVEWTVEWPDDDPGTLTNPPVLPDQSPAYRQHMRDAGRGGLLR